MAVPNRNVIKRFEKNQNGQDYVVGDLHGCFATLEHALGSIGFDPEHDRLFCVGDLVDRGPRSHEVYKWLQYPWFHSVMGNHEVKVLQYLYEKGLAEKTQLEMIELYKLGEYKKKQIEKWLIDVEPKEDIVNIFHAFNGLPLAFEIDTQHGLVGVLHADILHVDWGLFKRDLINDGYQGQTAKLCLNGRNRSDRGIKMPVLDIFAVYVGHSAVKKPTLLGNVVYIDTQCSYGKKLTLIRLSDHNQILFDYRG